MNELTLRIDAYFRSIALSASLDEAIRSTAEFLCRPVAIVDSALNHVGHAPDRLTGDGDWDTLITEGRVSPNYTEITRRNNAIPMPPDMLHRCVHSPQNGAEMEKYRCRLSSGALHLGGMMVLSDGRPFTQEDLLALQIACQTLSRALHNSAEPFYSRQKARQSILSDLLTRDPHDVLSEIAKHHPDLYAMEGKPMVVGYNDPHPGDYDLAPLWQQTFSATLPHGQVIKHGGALLFFSPLGEYDYAGFCDMVRQHLTHIHMQISLSDPFTSFLDLKAHYELACLAFSAGVLQSPDTSLYTVSDYRLQLMLQPLCNSRRLCHPAATLLREYDRENGTDYCRILRAYLFHFHNYSLAAKALFMHRNTLTYHLERIRKLLGVDLDDPATCYELLISLSMP